MVILRDTSKTFHRLLRRKEPLRQQQQQQQQQQLTQLLATGEMREKGDQLLFAFGLVWFPFALLCFFKGKDETQKRKRV